MDRGGKPQVLYSVRMSIDSLLKVGRKRRWWRGVKGGDLVFFVGGLALTNVVFEMRRGAVDKSFGKGVGWLRGEELWGGGEQRDQLERKKR